MGDRGMELREKIIDAICVQEDGSAADEIADRILAIPEIAGALAYMTAVDSAHPVFHEIREMLDRKNLTHRISTAEPD
jgi:uncharacterized protein with ACT and thioredoxin-like domain